MDYEQKYKDALDAARHIYDAMKSGGNFGGMEDLEVIFPELAESEDERIRKEMIEAISEIEPGKTYIRLSQEEKEAWIAYLERQKEQKSRIDACGFPLRDEGESACSYLERCLSPDMRNIWYEACSEIKEKQNEQKPISFNEPHNPDDYEVVIEGNGISLKRKEQKPWKVGANAYFTPEQKPAEWTKEDEERYISCLQRLGTGNPEQPETINSKWFKEHCHPQPKQEWSEEDEKVIDTIVSVLGQYIDYKAVSGTGSGYATPRYSKEIDWLKSLRPQPKEEDCNYITPSKEFFQWIYDRLVHVHKENPDVDYMRSFKERLNNLSFGDKCHWKPSKEQMDRLFSIVAALRKDYCDDMADFLASLYKQLKAL